MNPTTTICTPDDVARALREAPVEYRRMHEMNANHA